MKIIKANYLLTVDKEYKIVEDGAIVFDHKIIDIGLYSAIKLKYKDVETIDTKPNTVLMPGLINSHVHLEFSTNQSTLEYGDFMLWLKSVILKRDELVSKATTPIISSYLDKIQQNGTTTIGAISSNGFDLEACVKSDIKIVFFNEAIGSTPNMVDALYSDFINRYENSKEFASDIFYPSIAIHSPYAIHPFFTKKVLQLAKDDKCIVSAHLLESKAEREWLDSSSGDMKEFFESFLQQSTSLINSSDFIKQFNNITTIFTHALELNSDDINLISKNNHSIAHAPVSNRVLGNGKFDFNLTKDINTTIGTDGLSSNISLNLFDELRAALFMHNNFNLHETSKQLIKMATINGSNALKLNTGSIEIGKDADIIAVELPSDFHEVSHISTDVILHTKQPYMVFINGEQK